MIVNGYIQKIRDLMHDGGGYRDTHRSLIGIGTTPVQGTDTSLETEIDRSLLETDIVSTDTIIFERTYPKDELNADIISEAGVSAILETDDFWDVDPAIINGLPTSGNSYYYPNVFQIGTTWYLITGGYNPGVWYGYEWNGTTWITNSSIINGLPTGLGSRGKIVVIDGILHIMLVVGLATLPIKFYSWNGTIWSRASQYEDGLDLCTTTYIGCIFSMNDILYIIKPKQVPPLIYEGYRWSGSTWQSDSDITEGLPGYSGALSVLQIDGFWFIIIGSGTGYKLKDSIWESTNMIDSGITSGCSTQSTFFKDDYYQIIAGSGSSQHFCGFKEAMTPGTLMNRNVFSGFEKNSQFKLRVSTHLIIENE